MGTILEYDEMITFKTATMTLYFNKNSGSLTKLETLNGDSLIIETSTPFLRIHLNGEEHRPLPRRMPYYTNTTTIGDQLVADHFEISKEDENELQVVCSQDGFQVIWRIKVDVKKKIVSIGFDFVNQTGKEQIVRKAIINQTMFSPDFNRDRTSVFLPGVQGSLPYYNLSNHQHQVWPFGEYSIGAAGLIDGNSLKTWIGWSLSFKERVDQRVESERNQISLVNDYQFSGYLAEGESMTFSGAYYMFADEERQAANNLQHWFNEHHIKTPTDSPKWLEDLVIFETHIGTAVFKDNYSYTPYKTMKDLIDDLPRISSLGFTAIQVMPKQPYPCYAVHDYFDLSTSYGDKHALITLVSKAHDLGIRIILDVILHGVMDQYFIGKAEHQAKTSGDTHRLELNQTVIDFAPYWREGSPEIHDLVKQHPEWFVRDEEGEITGIYTNAFDAANEDWQNYFIKALKYMILELNIDGFRFDAPHWNSIPNWDRNIPYEAGESAVGPIKLFEKARKELRKIKGDLLFYTEPSTPLYRKNMDLNYNYDEHWLIQALLYDSASVVIGREKPSNKIFANEMAQWFDVRQRWLPNHSRTAHHVDSHDSFWWYPPGKKWRREQFGIPQTLLLSYIYLFIEGPFMMYIGGEEGIENDLKKGIQLKKSHPSLKEGLCDFIGGYSDNPTIFHPVRKTEESYTVCIANCSDQTEEVCISWSGADEINAFFPEGFYLKDLITDAYISDEKYTCQTFNQKKWKLNPFQVLWVDLKTKIDKK
ncbi:alpha-amylase family glycosyl hydrolase [Salipaludibacillus daqingensis]|uniref:alpha-amylase family glycosyl hydrolase n=1 Tax=Salipaludibacillus daqingensis TaxID=3041001 RepID=UPI0024769086|nr:alpha-amylase family glycosyl hydrolase [Salipaludibacillus daqingensis]